MPRGMKIIVIPDSGPEPALYSIRNLGRIAPRGFDVIFETTRAAPIVERAFQYIAPGGKIVLYGIVTPDQNAQVNPFDICRKDLHVMGSFSSVNSRLSP